MGLGRARLWPAETLHDGISYNAATGRVVLKAPGAAPTITTLSGAFTFTGGNQSRYMGPAGVLIASVTNTPRIEYDASGNCLGLLMEAARTNLCLQSQTFDNASWAKAQSSVSQNTTTAPDGTTTADSFIENGASAQHVMTQIGITSLTAATVYCASVFVKAAGRTRGRFIFVDSTQTDGVSVNFNLGTGAVTGATGLGAGTLTASGITAYPSGWYRIWASGAMNNARTTGGPYINLQDAAGNNSYLGDSVSGLHVWGAQLEVGTFPSSYIVTTTTSIARTADVCTRALSTEFSASAGSVVVAGRMNPGQASTRQPACSFDDGTGNERIPLVRPASSDLLQLRIDDGGVNQSAIGDTVTNGGLFKVGAAWAANDAAMVLNTGAVQTDAVLTLPTVTTLGIGYESGSATQFNGHVRRFDYWPTRLANPVLQRLCT